jgi:hypothetical protein
LEKAQTSVKKTLLQTKLLSKENITPNFGKQLFRVNKSLLQKIGKLGLKPYLTRLFLILGLSEFGVKKTLLFYRIPGVPGVFR